MTPTQISKAMIKCATNYLAVAEEKGSNYVETSCSKFEHEYENIYKITLEKRLKTLDGSCLKVYSNVIEPEFYLDFNKRFLKEQYYEIVDYDDEKGIITISFDTNILPYIEKTPKENISIVCDLAFIIKNVKTWYELHGKELKRPKANSIPVSEIFFTGRESEEQRKTVETALNGKVTYVWGPPGTGKTQVVLADCIMTYVKQKKTVIICAPTNLALEQTLRSVINEMQKIGIDYECVSRLGFPTKSFADEFPKACEYQEKQNRTEELAKKIQKAKDRLALFDVYYDIKCKISTYNEITARFPDLEEQLKTIKEKIDFCESEISDIGKDLEPGISNVGKELEIEEKLFKEIKQTYINSKLELSELQSKIEELKKREQTLSYRIKSKFVQLEHSSDYNEILEQKQHCVLENENNYVSQLNKIERIIENIKKDKALKEQELDKLKSEYYLYSELRSEAIEERETLEKKVLMSAVPLVKTTFKNIAQLSNVLNDMSKEYTDAKKKKLCETITECEEKIQQTKKSTKDALVFACTMDWFFTHYTFLKDCQKSHVFLDEAAYVPLVKAGILFSLNVPITFLGDHMQLPPICVAEEKELENIETLLFLWSQSAIHFSELLSEKCTIETAFEKYMNHLFPSPHSIKTTFLSKTFRFGDNLAKVLDKFVYKNGFSGQKSFDTEIVVVNTDSKVENFSSVNEAMAIKAYINKSKPEDYAVLAPYRKQCAVLYRNLSANKDNVLTIHKSQGREWQTVILSVVDTHPYGFTNTATTIGKYVLNTAISRAKENVIVVCNANKWKRYADSQLIGNLVSIATKHIKQPERTSQ